MNSEAVPETALPVNSLHGVNHPAWQPLESAALPAINVAQLRSARPQSAELLRLAVTVWRQRGLALIDPLALGADAAREAVLAEANRLYGRRVEKAEGL